jgi:Flp pilus assembly secretin CpaC
MRHFALAIALVTAVVISPAAADEPRTPMTLVRVKILDIDLTAARKLNVQSTAAGGDRTRESAFVKRIQDGESTVAENGRMDSFLMSPDDAGHAMLNAIRKSQLATAVAEPNLAAALGKPARYRLGGEFPIPTDATANAVTMKEYGTDVEVVVNEHGPDRAVVDFTIRLSEIDEQRAIKVRQYKIPALRNCDANSAFESKWGETFVLCLKQADQKKGLGNTHEMLRVILVTPERIAPLESKVAAKPTASAQ